MDVGTLLASFLAALNIGLIVRTLVKEWRARRQAPAHPLEPALRDIAQAIRETGGQT